MPRVTLLLKPTEDLQDLIAQLNTLLREVELILQRVEGLDGTTPQVFNDLDMNNKTFIDVNPVAALKTLNGETQTLPTVDIS